MKFISERIRSAPLTIGLLLLFIIIGACLRFKALSFQSFWLDEISTMLITRRDLRVEGILAFLKRVDPHPPFYFLLMHYWLKVFTPNEFTARLLSAITGTLTIPAIYFLGKEIYNRQVGLIAAVFTTINYFNIFYSQEARDYIFVFLFTCLSFTFFVRTLRNPSWKSAFWYALTTVLLLYTHYFSFMVVAAQMMIVAILLFIRKSWWEYITRFGAAYAAMFILYLPWLPVAVALGKRESFWAKKPGSNFFVNYFSDYFGNDTFSVYLFAFLLIVFLAGSASVFRTQENPEKKEQNSFIFIVLGTWILISYLIPYVRSLTTLPMLVNRYTIIALPAILICAAIGAEFIANRPIKMYIVALAVLLSLIHLFANRYYETPTRAQWREMSAFVLANEHENIPVVTDRAWHLAYYFGNAKYKPVYYSDAFLSKLDRFWVITGNNGKPISDQKQMFLQRYFRMLKSFKGISTSARLFTRQRLELKVQGGSSLPNGQHILSGDGFLHTDAIKPGPGDYSLAIYGYGAGVNGEYPKLRVTMNEKVLGEFSITDQKDYLFNFQLKDNSPVSFSIDFVNRNASGVQAVIQFVDVQRLNTN